MKTIASCLFTALLFQAPLCHAWEVKRAPVNFVGTWVAESEGVYVEAADPATRPSGWEQPRSATRQSLIKISHQDGHRFWGERIGDDRDVQPFIAVVDLSESTIVAVDAKGAIRGKVLNPNTFSYCYTQVPSKQNDLAYVECTVARRKSSQRRQPLAIHRYLNR